MTVAMAQRPVFCWLQLSLWAVVLGMTLSSPGLYAHEGHDHGVEAAPLPSLRAARGDAQSDLFEAVAILQGDHVDLYLDRFADNAPVLGAKVEIESPEYSGIAEESAPGVYMFHLPSAPESPVALTVSIEKGNDFDVLGLRIDPQTALDTHSKAPAPTRRILLIVTAVGALLLIAAGIVVRRKHRGPRALGPVTGVVLGAFLVTFGARTHAHGGEDHSHDEPQAEPGPAGTGTAGNKPEVLSDGSVWVSKPTQRQLQIRTVLTRFESFAASQDLSGVVLADPGHSGRVQAPLTGYVLPGPEGMPQLGQVVRKDQVLVYLRPVEGTLDRGNQLSTLADIDAQLAIAEQRNARLQQLEASVARKDREAAAVELKSLRTRRSELSKSVFRDVPLRAPVDGTIGAAFVQAGNVVDSKDTLFDLVDPKRMNVEALAYDLGTLPERGPAEVIWSHGERELRQPLSWIGRAGQLRGQALPLLFSVDQATSELFVGQRVKVRLYSPSSRVGVVLPRSALQQVSDRREQRIWLHVAPERFVHRLIQLEPVDADRMAVSSGLQPGERVVTDGAHWLDQMTGPR